MIRLTYGQARNVAIGVWALSVALMLRLRPRPPTPRRRQPTPRTSRRSSRRNAKRAPARLDGADVAHDIRRGAALGALDQGRVGDRQMPPWQIDRTVGIQKFKNDRSLTDDQVETIVRW